MRTAAAAVCAAAVDGLADGAGEMERLVAGTAESVEDAAEVTGADAEGRGSLRGSLEMHGRKCRFYYLIKEASQFIFFLFCYFFIF